MIWLNFFLHVTFVYALPSNITTITCTSSNGPSLLFVNSTDQTALLWTSIGLAVVTSFLQGLIVTIVTIAEDQGMWTFRFRLARYEHWWWTAVSIMLFTSFCFIVFSFLAGNSSNSLGVLTLSTATAIAIVRYAIPAWRNRIYIKLRWLSWTGPSRTGIALNFGKICGTKSDWIRIQNRRRKEHIVPAPPSDEWGWTFKPTSGIAYDPTALLKALNPKTITELESYPRLGPCVYDDGYKSGDVSLQWGEKEGFRRRVSRAISSMPSTLLNSVPSTYDGFNGTGLCLAAGILGRNKGLAPFRLVFDLNDQRKTKQGITRSDLTRKVSVELEATSAWFPRPNKVMRSFYLKSMAEQYSGLGDEYVAVAVELALILLDCPPHVTKRWLDQNLEQQSMEVNQQMSGRQIQPVRIVASDAELQTLYRASYTSMILSINYYDQDIIANARRPDLTCFALLWLAEGGTAPVWWKEKWVKDRVNAEASCLKGNWKRAASWLLGLADTPPLQDWVWAQDSAARKGTSSTAGPATLLDK